MQITHDGEILFKRVFTIKNADGTLRDISAIVPALQITLNGFTILSIEGADVERNDTYSRFVLRKAPSAFTGFDCAQQYRFRFFDTVTGSVFAKGVFRISNCAQPGAYAAFGVSSVSGSAVDNSDPANPVINIPEVPEIELPENIVQSVTGSAVDNTDPNNPKIDLKITTEPKQVHGSNLFNKTGFMADTAISSTGVLASFPPATGSQFARTAKMDLWDPLQTKLKVSGLQNLGTASKRWVVKNAAETILSYGNILSDPTSVIDIPVGGKYFYLQYKHPTLDNDQAGDAVMVNYGTAALPYAAYSGVTSVPHAVSIGGIPIKTLPDNELATYATKAFTSAFQPYFGKKFASIGDSITAQMYWQQLLADFIGAIFNPAEVSSATKPLGVSGSTIKPIITGLTGQAAGQSIYFRADYVKDYTPELIVLLGGQNDGIDAVYNLLDPEYTGAEVLSTAGTLPSFVSSYKGVLRKLITQNQSAKIVALTPMYTGAAAYTEAQLAGYKLRNETIKSICAIYSVQCVDLLNEVGISPLNNALHTQDGIHPNALGGLKMARLIASKL